MKKNNLMVVHFSAWFCALALTLSAATPASAHDEPLADPGATPARQGPFTPEELHARFRAMFFGINKEYNSVPVEARPEGCVVFEIRILRDGVASWFHKKEGEFHNAALLKRIETAVLNRFDMAKDRLKEPQIALQTLCFTREGGVAFKSTEDIPPPPPPKQAAELMDHERNGVSNREWLESLMATEGQPLEETSSAPVKALPQGTVAQP